MDIDRRRLLTLLATFALISPVSRPAFAQTWPARPVRLVVPYAPGGSTDTVARIAADRLSRSWGQQVVIENEPGAGTNIGAAAVAPVALVCTFPLVMLVPNASPARSLADFIAFAKENKGRTTFASPGVGTVPHLAGELFKQTAGIAMTHVPYRGDAPALVDTMAGRVDLQIGGGALLEQVRGGQVRGLAVTTAKRSRFAPELPTVAESAVPSFDVSGWFAFFVPAKTPRVIVEKIHVDTAAAVGDPNVKARFDSVSMLAVGSTPEELAALLKDETEKWSGVIKVANIALDY
jgi:tripartite-type tricarboxylate transporter receptor subunit TctC